MAETGETQGLCARFHKAVELIGGRWTGALIQLLLNGPARYCELRQAVPEISDRMLSERLRELEIEGIVQRAVYAETPVRIEYALTAKGKALEPALAAIGKWASRYVEAPPRAITRANAVRTRPPKRARS
jgi:DNA-binding HxlR family transcriptional regulator